MNNVRISDLTYWLLIIVLTVLTAVSVYLQPSQILNAEELPAPMPVLALANAAVALIAYGGLGYLGLRITRRIGFADIWDDAVTNRQRFFIPAIAGVAVGLFFIVADIFIGQFHTLGPLPHPEFPLSLVASITAAIGEELLFRLFFVSFWVWLVSWVILKQRYFEQVFWVVSVVSALAFAAGHLPAALLFLKIDSITEIPAPMMLEIFLLNSALSIPAALYLRKYGFLAAVGIHFWTDVVWHVLYGWFA